MVSEHLYVNYYYLKTFETKFQSTKLYLTPFKVILRKNHFKFCMFIVRPEKFQFLEKWQNRNFDYKIVISVKNP